MTTKLQQQTKHPETWVCYGYTGHATNGCASYGYGAYTHGSLPISVKWGEACHLCGRQQNIEGKSLAASEVSSLKHFLSDKVTSEAIIIENLILLAKKFNEVQTWFNVELNEVEQIITKYRDVEHFIPRELVMEHLAITNYLQTHREDIRINKRIVNDLQERYINKWL